MTGIGKCPARRCKIGDNNELMKHLPRVKRSTYQGWVHLQSPDLYIFGGGLIRFGGTKQFWLRLIRRGRARPDSGDLVDFRFVVEGKVLRWPEAVTEYNRNDDDISVWIRKQDKFALRLAVEEELRRRGLHGWAGVPRLFGTTDERFSWLRDRWLALPLFLRPVLYFFYRYLLTGGFLDGRAGFLYHALQGFWLRLVVDWKIDQLRHYKLSNADLLKSVGWMLATHSGSVEDLLETEHQGESNSTDHASDASTKVVAKR